MLCVWEFCTWRSDWIEYEITRGEVTILPWICNDVGLTETRIFVYTSRVCQQYGAVLAIFHRRRAIFITLISMWKNISNFKTTSWGEPQTTVQTQSLHMTPAWFFQIRSCLVDRTIAVSSSGNGLYDIRAIKRKNNKHNAELQRADPGTKVTG